MNVSPFPFFCSCFAYVSSSILLMQVSQCIHEHESVPLFQNTIIMAGNNVKHTDPYAKNQLRCKLRKWEEERDAQRKTWPQLMEEQDADMRKKAEAEKEKETRRSMTPVDIIEGWEAEVQSLKDEISRLELRLFEAGVDSQ